MGQLLGLQLASEEDLVRLAKRGASVHALMQAARTLRVHTITVCPATTLRRRQANRQRLSLEETERLIRLVRVFVMARALFDDATAASDWLCTTADFLGDGQPITPYELATSESGARLVEALLYRTAHGFVA